MTNGQAVTACRFVIFISPLKTVILTTDGHGWTQIGERFYANSANFR